MNQGLPIILKVRRKTILDVVRESQGEVKLFSV